MKLLKESTAKKIDALLKRDQGLVGGEVKPPLLNPLGPNWQFVRVTGESVEDVSNYGHDSTEEDYAGTRDYYPGVVVLWNSISETSTELEAVWVIDYNGDDLESGRVYQARQTGNRDVNTSTRPVFVTVVSGSVPLDELPDADQYEGYGDTYYGDGCEITDTITIDANKCVDGKNVTQRITIDSPFPLRVCIEDL